MLASCASRSYDERRAFLDRAQPARAEVVEAVRHQGSGRRSGSYFSYRLRFRALGRSVEASADDTDGFSEHSQGESVGVLYDPDDPTRVAIDSFSHRWFRVGLPAVLGGGCLLEGMLLLWIVSAPNAPTNRTAATLPELWQAFRQGHVRRGSEFRGLLLAFSIVGVALATASLLVLLFAGSTLKILLSFCLAWSVFLAWRGNRKGRRLASKPR